MNGEYRCIPAHSSQLTRLRQFIPTADLARPEDILVVDVCGDQIRAIIDWITRAMALEAGLANDGCPTETIV